MKKFNLILTSSGFNDVNNYVSEEIIELFKKICFNKKIMILANAAPKESSNFIARENVKNNFIKVGAKTVDIIDINKENTSTINNYDVVYALGGKLNYLIDLNLNTDIKKELVKFLEHGIYIGESAGSMVLCDDLKWAFYIKESNKSKDDDKTKTYIGFNLINNKILPHYNKLSLEEKDRVRRYEKENGIIFTKLNDGEFIFEKLYKIIL